MEWPPASPSHFQNPKFKCIFTLIEGLILHLKYRGHFTIADGPAFTIEIQLRVWQYTWYILIDDVMSPKILLDIKGEGWMEQCQKLS